MGAFGAPDVFFERRQDGTTIGGAPTGGGTTGGGAPTGGGSTPPGGGTTGGGGATPPGTTAAGPPTGGSTGVAETSPPGGGTTGGAGTDAPPTGGGTTAPPGGGTTAPPGGGTTAPPDGGTTAPPGGETTALPGGGTADPTGGTTVPGGDTTIPPDGGTAVPTGGTTPTDGGTTSPGGGTTIPPGGGTTLPTTPTTTPNGDTTITSVPSPITTSRSRSWESWEVTSTWCPPELSTIPQYAAQPTFTGTTTIDGTAWVQTTLDAPLTTVYTTESLYTEHGQAMTKYVPVTTVIPPGTVVIRHNLAVGKKSSKVPILAGALGGVAALLLIGALAFFLVRRRRRREAAGNLQIEIDPSSPTRQPTYPGLPPPMMSQVTGNSQLLQPAVTGSTNYGGIGAQTNPSAYSYNGHTPMDAVSIGGTSSMYASTNYGRSTSPGVVGNQPVHYRSPSAASGGTMPGNQAAPSVTGHVGHYRAESGPIGIVQEDDPLLGPFSDSNRVPTPSSVMPLVHEDAGSIRNMEVGGAWSPPAYQDGRM